MTTPTTTICIELDERDLRLLHVSSARASGLGELFRFESPRDEDLRSRTWAGGRMFWCATVADALMLRSHERQNGYESIILRDRDPARATGEMGAEWVVLSSRRSTS